MSRSLRIEYKGAWHHVINRGGGKRVIFHTEKQYRLFFKLLSEIYDKYEVEVHAYCLMNNHYHLLLHTPQCNLSHAMRHLDGVYVQKYNYFQKTDGPLFRGRFKSILIDADNYLMQLSRYIHLNPVVAKIVDQPEDYLWSSYSAYISRKMAPDWLFTAEISSFFKNSTEEHRAFIAEGVDIETNDFFESKKISPIFGSRNFIKQIKKQYVDSENISKDIPERKYLRKSVDLDEIIQLVAEHYKVNKEVLKMSGQKRNKSRAVAIYLVRVITKKELNVIANEFGNISVSTVCCYLKRVQQRMFDDQEFAAEVAYLKREVTG